MKIVFFTPVNISYNGGFEEWLLNITKHLKNKGNKVHVIDSDYPENKKIDWKHITRTTIKTGKFHKIPKNEFKKIQGIIKNYDVLYYNHVNIAHEKLFSKLKIKKIAGYHAPLFRGHLIYDNYLKIIGKNYLKSFDAHHVINSSDYKKLSEWEFKNVKLIPNGVDTYYFKCKKNKKNKEFKILFSGRHELQKGFDILLKAIKKIKDDDIQFTFTGKGSLTPKLLELMKKDKRITYKGFIKKTNEEYCNNDLLIVPSRKEPFGLVIIEAQSSCLPVLSTPTKGGLDLIINEKNGYLMDELSINEIIKKIKLIKKTYFNDYDTFNKIGITARKIVIRDYSLKKINNNLSNFFKKIANKQSFFKTT